MGFWILVVSNIVTWMAIVILFLSLRIVGTKLGTMVLDADDIARLAVDKSTENSVVLIRAGLARLTSTDPKTAKLVYQPPQAVMHVDNLSDERKEEIRQEIEKMRNGTTNTSPVVSFIPFRDDDPGAAGVGAKLKPVEPGGSPSFAATFTTNRNGGVLVLPKGNDWDYASHPEASTFPWGY